MSDKTLRAIGAAVVLFGISIAALVQIDRRGNPDETVIQPAPGSTLAAAADTAPEAEPFVYRLGVLASISTDNFWEFYGSQPSVWNAYILGPTKPALFTANTPDGSLRPELAAAEVSPKFDENGWRVRVKLSDDMFWSDTRPITAQDVVFTFETARSLRLGGSWADAFPDIIESMHADARDQLRIEFSERPGLAVWPHAIGLAPIMPAHVWQDVVSASADAAALYRAGGAIDVGGGPLALSEAKGDVVVSVGNPGYPQAQPPQRVEYHVFPNEETAVAALAAGEIDSVLSPKGLANAEVETLADSGDVTVAHSPSNSIRYLGFNLARAPMSDQAFRTALAHLLDRERLASEIPGALSAAYAFVSPENEAWYDQDRAEANAGRYRGDPATRLANAVAVLEGAGYAWVAKPALGPDGTVVPGTGLTVAGAAPAPLTILTSGDAYDPSRPRYAEEIAAALGWLGFDARPVETDFDSVVDLAFTPGDDGALHYDMYLLGWTLGNPSLPGHYRALFAPDGELNNTGYRSEQFAAQLEAYEHAHRPDQALAALWEMEAILAADLPYLPLYTSDIIEVYRSDRVAYGSGTGLGGLQGRLGAIGDVRQVP